MGPATYVDMQVEEKVYSFLWNIIRIVLSIISHFIALCPRKNLNKSFHHHHVLEGLGMLACSLILQMKLVPPSLPRSSYVSSSVWFVF